MLLPTICDVSRRNSCGEGLRAGFPGDTLQKSDE